jgi:Cu2+-exporting ATPase
VRVADLWPRLSRVRRIVFDKTGTLTGENPELANPEELISLDATARSALAALVRDNLHPRGRALYEALLAAGDASSAAGTLHETIGQGVTLATETGEWRLGRASWAENLNAGEGAKREEAETVFTRDGQVVARFRFRETPRVGASADLDALRRRGFALAILSGDEPNHVAALARAVGVSEECARGALTPQEKAAWVERNGGGETLLLGDGANDSLAFDRALCRGTPVVYRGVLAQKADFYYLGRGLAGLPALFAVNDTRRRTQAALLVFSVVYNAVAVGLAVAGKMNPLLAAILMPISSLLTLVIVVVGLGKTLRDAASHSR